MSDTYLDAALAGFSGYLAVDEVYDGPFRVLCVVDNRAFSRLACAVLDHDPDGPTATAVRSLVVAARAQEETA